MHNSVKFILDNRIVEIDFPNPSGLSPTMTVLNWLRSIPGHKGVKEGCAEGDCGACTVVLAEPGEGSNLRYKSVDSCLLFLPMIHGSQLITVENLSTNGNNMKELHPVQKQLVETNGTQCGYCTPGIVMSLFGIYKNHVQPAEEVIQDALVGNLCRCTGYRPIIEAARNACNSGATDHFSRDEKKIFKLLEKIRSDKEVLDLSSSKQRYFKPFTLKDALQIRSEHPEALIINGSTDIALLQTKRHEILPAVLDLSGVEELSGAREEPDCFVFGSGITIEQLKTASIKNFPALHKMLAVFGSLQIRNLATLGGNICSASPIGDTLPFLIACDARVKVRSTENERNIPVEKFITGYRKTGIKKDELLTEIIIPRTVKTEKISCYKVSRRKDLDISTVSVAIRLKAEEGRVKYIALVYGGMAARVSRAVKTEKFLKGKEWSRENIEEAMKVLEKEFSPITDARSEADYRRKVAANLLLKFYLETVSSGVFVTA
jgi:xanthine dehydrogenase small subunit